MALGGGDSNLYGYVLGDGVNFIDPIGLANTMIIGPPVLIKPEEGEARMSDVKFEDIDGFCGTDGWYKLGGLGTCYIFSKTGVVVCFDLGLIIPQFIYTLAGKHSPGQKGNNYSNWGKCNEKSCSEE